MTTRAEVRAGLAAAASTCGVEVYPYPPDQPIAGSGWVVFRDMDPRLVFGQGTSSYPMGIVVVFNRLTGQPALDTLCEVSGTGSLCAAVQDGSNWQADIDYAAVTRIAEPQVITVDGVEYLAAEFDIEVVW